MFWYNIAYIVNSFAALLYITVMINISQEINKVVHEKMLRVINLYWFHNDTLETNNSLNGHSNEHGINE